MATHPRFGTAGSRQARPIDPRTTEPARQLLNRGERRAQILSAAATSFARGGYAATSMDDVAAEAGITKLIVYRHFDSKAALYEAILHEVHGRLAEEFVKGLNLGDRRGVAVRALMTVARENPDGFRLLIVHAPREEAFAEYAENFRDLMYTAAEHLVGDSIPDPVLRAWATRALVGYVADAVLAWLEVGDAERDEELIENATLGLHSLYETWSSDPPGG